MESLDLDGIAFKSRDIALMHLPVSPVAIRITRSRICSTVTLIVQLFRQGTKILGIDLHRTLASKLEQRGSRIKESHALAVSRSMRPISDILE